MGQLTKANPLESPEPMKVAAQLLKECWETKGKRGLWVWRGEPWEWYGDRWCRRDPSWLVERVWVELEDAHVTVRGAEGSTRVVRHPPNRLRVMDIVEALWAHARFPHMRAPVWLDKTGVEGVDEGKCVGFQDKVVIVGGPDGVFSVERTSDWFDPAVLPVPWDPEAQCPTWLRCIREWGGGDPEWEELLARMMGYALLGGREFQRWFLLWGRPRSGKGTSQWVLERLLGSAVHHASVRQLANRYGLWGSEHARVLSVTEFSELEGREGHEAAGTLKSLVGEDPIMIERKYLEPLRGVRVPAVVIVQSNEVPNLPNKGQGLSDKLCVLPFQNTWLHREDVRLKEKLEAELPGIAAWAVFAAQRLIEAAPEERWPVPESAKKAEEQFEHFTNPFKAFLEAKFEKAPGGFVSNRELQRAWREWEVQEDLPKTKERYLANRLVQEGGWTLQLGRLGGVERIRGVWGLMTKDVDSE